MRGQTAVNNSNSVKNTSFTGSKTIKKKSSRIIKNVTDIGYHAAICSIQ